jgi:hypothetical protein
LTGLDSVLAGKHLDKGVPFLLIDYTGLDVSMFLKEFSELVVGNGYTTHKQGSAKHFDIIRPDCGVKLDMLRKLR